MTCFKRKIIGFTKSHVHLSLLGVGAIVAGLPGSAQAQAPNVLPGIVVQGANLTPAPRARPQAAPESTTQAPRSAGSAGQGGTSVSNDGGDAVGSSENGAVAGSGTGAGGGQGFAPETVGSAVSVVTGEQLRQQQIRNASDALRSLPGVSVSRGGGFAGQTQVRVRGGEANHTLVLIDGIVANDTNNGAFDFSDLSAENIERIEVIRGPQSGLYGSNALGGVINIVTKGGRGPLEVTARTEGGSFGTFDYALRASGGNDRAWASMSYHERHSTGFDISPIGHEKDGALLKTFAFKGGVKIVEGVQLDYTLRYSDKRGDRDTEGGPGPLSIQVDSPAKFTNSVFLGGVNLKWDTLDGRVTHVFRASRNETRTADVSPDFRANNISEAVKYGYLGTWRFDTPGLAAVKQSLTALVEKESESFSPLSDFSDNLTRNRDRVATALEWRGDIANRLFLTANVRHDNNDTFQDFTTWRTAASLKLSEWGLRPHASVGTGVKLPTMFENFGSIPTFFTPNPNLQPEESKGYDAGIELTLWKGRAIFDVTYFNQELTNKIDGFAAGPNFTFTAVNTPGISHREGLEFEGKVRVLPGVLLGGAYTHLTATDSVGLAEIRRPKHAARMDATYLFDRDRGKISVAALYNGAMMDTAFRVTDFGAERVVLSQYWLVNVAASYEVSPGVEVFGRVENLLNERYYEIYGFNTPGIGAYGGVKVTLGGEGRPPLFTEGR